MSYDIVIIGAGPAGMNAALNAVRAGRSVIVIEKETIGGQISFAPKVENFPTVFSSPGADIMNSLYEQILQWNIEVALEEVTDIKKTDTGFIIKTDMDEYTSKAVIIASGVKHKTLDIPREQDLVGNGVSYCALCDGQFYENKDVAVIGDGNTALQYSMLLATYCKSVTICTLFDKFFGDKTLVDRLASKDNIVIKHNLKLTDLIGEKELEALDFVDNANKKTTIPVSAVFICIGQVPNNNIFKDLVKLDENGYIVANENGETSTSGVFAAGDCRTKSFRQMIGALSDGANASFSACKYLETL